MLLLYAMPFFTGIANVIMPVQIGAPDVAFPRLNAFSFWLFLFGGLIVAGGLLTPQGAADFGWTAYFPLASNTAHFHYVLVGAVVFASFAGTHFWWPKLTGKMLNERLGKLTFWLLFIGFNTTFLVQHWIGITGLPRRYWTYLPEDGITWMNQVSSIGSVIMSLAVVVFILNIWITARNAPRVGLDDPWGFGRSLEWATASPIPRHNFTKIPRIRSESPAFDANHPELPPPATS
jgi:cytochrome c oxidase subunit 1